MTEAYALSFTGENVRKSFAKTGIYPLDSTKLIGVARPLSETCPEVISTPEEMELMLEEKRQKRRDSSGVAPVILSRGFLNTKQGLVLTSAEAMNLVRTKERQEARKKEAQYRKTVCSEAKFAKETRE